MWSMDLVILYSGMEIANGSISLQPTGRQNVDIAREKVSHYRGIHFALTWGNVSLLKQETIPLNKQRIKVRL